MYAMKSILREDRDDISICIQHALVERKILSSVSHPYICELKCAFQDPSKVKTNFFFFFLFVKAKPQVYFMLQYLPGGDLMKMIEHSDGKGLSANAVMIYSAEIALALDYLHERHIIYRDLS
jgi:serine/threonine protein kinase